ncbi:MAG: ferrochelatase, partial [Phenylobacterium sp.]|nr:ferrochelatase [Phenylobacterium sp.]
DGLAESHARAIRGVWEWAGRPEGVRLLFSAHGLPERVVAGGDPYQAQVEATAAEVAARLPEFTDWQISYQSRVGPLKWIGPSTDDEIRRAGSEGVGVLVSPIAFVSEHVETLVELDHEYAELAQESGCPVWLRAAAPGTDPSFISALAEAVGAALERSGGVAPDGNWTCPRVHGRCPRLAQAAGARR